jgi:hypothetical protein
MDSKPGGGVESIRAGSLQLTQTVAAGKLWRGGFLLDAEKSLQNRGEKQLLLFT